MDLAHGGHLTHGHKANFSGRFYDVTHYGVSPDDERIDYAELEKTARSLNPALIFAGIGMMVTALLLWAPAPTFVGAVVGPLTTAALLVWLYVDRHR